ncbi:MAG: DNA primase [Candidatus Eremiobacterota bacterium]
MSRITEELIGEIKNKNNLLDLISCYVTLKKSGKSYQGLCPFHSERTPSFSVNPEKGLWYCFGCSSGGDIFDFLKKVENLSFFEAVTSLAERAGIAIPESEGTGYSEAYKDKKDLYTLNKLAADFYHWVLLKQTDSNAVSYLKERKVTGDIIVKFKIGYAPFDKQSLVKVLNKKKYSMELALSGGLVRREQDGHYRDYFINRIMFPIFDLRDRVIGFGGRIIGDGNPKYLNTPETPVFNKGKNLYGLNMARKREDKASPLILTEGYMDLLSVSQAGCEGVVASLGTSLTMEQANLLRKFTSEVILAYDADTAGVSATGRGVGLLESAGLSVKSLILPEAKDPDEFIRLKGKDAFHKILEDRVDYFFYLITWLEKKYDLTTKEGKEDFLKGIEPFMTNVQNSLNRHEYFKIIESKNLGLSDRELMSRFRTYKEKKNLKVPVDTGKSFADTERILLRLMLQNEDVMKLVFQKFKPDGFSDSICHKIAQICYKNFLAGQDFSSEELAKEIHDEKEKKVLAEMLLLEDDYPHGEGSVLGLIKTLKDKKLIDRKKEIDLMLEQGKVKPSDEIFKEYQKLLRYLKGGKSLSE